MLMMHSNRRSHCTTFTTTAELSAHLRWSSKYAVLHLWSTKTSLIVRETESSVSSVVLRSQATKESLVFTPSKAEILKLEQSMLKIAL